MTETATLDFDQLTLTPDQQSALDAFQDFLLDPLETVFVLSGYSGCGKSTLVRVLLDRLPKIQKTIKLINPSATILEPVLTATTNKAAENLALITGSEAITIHAALGLRVTTDFKTMVTTLTVNNRAPIVENRLVFVDEASFVDKNLLQLISQRTSKCKIIFIGDPAQLAPVNSASTPVFAANFKGAALTQVVRQAEGNPIVDLSTKFRNTVNTGDFFSFKPDGHHIQHMDRDAFEDLVAAEFTRPDWKYADSKVLAWTNACVIGFNKKIRNLAKGTPNFEVGDYAVCNSFVSTKGKSLKTDQLVQITRIDDETEYLGAPGNWVEIDHTASFFHPRTLDDRNLAAKLARQEKRIQDVATIESSWIDLRGAYACTINKAQGSTFGSVYIDLDDVSRCHNGNQLARMLYVAVSRAKNHVYLTGDLVG